MKKTTNKKGQIVVEYMLILLVGMVVATILITLVDFPGGSFIKWWRVVLQAMGADLST